MRERGIEPTSAAISSPKVSSPQPLDDGPGTILLEMNKRDYGVPFCEDCNTTARRMNEGGPDWCIEHIEELIDEIQPRVQKWLEAGEVGGEKVTEPTWTMKMAAKFPDAAKRKKIADRIRKAVKEHRARSKKKSEAEPQDLLLSGPADR